MRARKFQSRRPWSGLGPSVAVVAVGMVGILSGVGRASGYSAFACFFGSRIDSPHRSLGVQPKAQAMAKTVWNFGSDFPHMYLRIESSEQPAAFANRSELNPARLIYALSLEGKTSSTLSICTSSLIYLQFLSVWSQIKDRFCLCQALPTIFVAFNTHFVDCNTQFW